MIELCFFYVQDRIELLLVEKSSLERSKKSLEDELATLAKDKLDLGDALNKTSKESGSVRNAVQHLEKANKNLSKEIQEKLVLIGQLERVRLRIRERTSYSYAII